MMSLSLILISALCAIFNVYMWYKEITSLRLIQFFMDLAGTLLIILLFAGAGSTVSGFAISMIISAIWSIISEIENAKRKKKKLAKQRAKLAKKEASI